MERVAIGSYRKNSGNNNGGYLFQASTVAALPIEENPICCNSKQARLPALPNAFTSALGPTGMLIATFTMPEN
jgi:hypothetical protein